MGARCNGDKCRMKLGLRPALTDLAASLEVGSTVAGESLLIDRNVGPVQDQPGSQAKLELRVRGDRAF